jgi:hypothetical protein
LATKRECDCTGFAKWCLQGDRNWFSPGKTENKRFGRPCDILQWDMSSFFITDDKNGVLYYVWKEN